MELRHPVRCPHAGVARIRGGNGLRIGRGRAAGGNKRLERTGRFRIYTTGPTSRVFNFGDAAGRRWQCARNVLARQAHRPADLRLAGSPSHRKDRPHRTARSGLVRARPETAVGTGVALECGLPDARRSDLSQQLGRSRCAVPGHAARDNKAPHAHLDLGSFIFEAGGVRWAIDLGPDDYGPGINGRTFSATTGRGPKPTTRHHRRRESGSPRRSPYHAARIHTRPGVGPVRPRSCLSGKVKTMQRRIGTGTAAGRADTGFSPRRPAGRSGVGHDYGCRNHASRTARRTAQGQLGSRGGNSLRLATRCSTWSPPAASHPKIPIREPAS